MYSRFGNFNCLRGTNFLYQNSLEDIRFYGLSLLPANGASYTLKDDGIHVSTPVKDNNANLNTGIIFQCGTLEHVLDSRNFDKNGYLKPGAGISVSFDAVDASDISDITTAIWFSKDGETWWVGENYRSKGLQCQAEVCSTQNIKNVAGEAESKNIPPNKFTKNDYISFGLHLGYQGNGKPTRSCTLRRLMVGAEITSEGAKSTSQTGWAPGSDEVDWTQTNDRVVKKINLDRQVAKVFHSDDLGKYPVDYSPISKYQDGFIQINLVNYRKNNNVLEWSRHITHIKIEANVAKTSSKDRIICRFTYKDTQNAWNTIDVYVSANERGKTSTVISLPAFTMLSNFNIGSGFDGTSLDVYMISVVDKDLAYNLRYDRDLDQSYTKDVNVFDKDAEYKTITTTSGKAEEIVPNPNWNNGRNDLIDPTKESKESIYSQFNSGRKFPALPNPPMRRTGDAIAIDDVRFSYRKKTRDLYTDEDKNWTTGVIYRGHDELKEDVNPDVDKL